MGIGAMIDRRAPVFRETGADLTTTRLWLATDLGIEERNALQQVCGDVRRFAAKRDVVKERTPTDVIHILLDGWACRYKLAESVARQIPTLLLPGDIADIDALLFDELD